MTEMAKVEWVPSEEKSSLLGIEKKGAFVLILEKERAIDRWKIIKPRRNCIGKSQLCLHKL